MQKHILISERPARIRTGKPRARLLMTGLSLFVIGTLLLLVYLIFFSQHPLTLPGVDASYPHLCRTTDKALRRELIAAFQDLAFHEQMPVQRLPRQFDPIDPADSNDGRLSGPDSPGDGLLQQLLNSDANGNSALQSGSPEELLQKIQRKAPQALLDREIAEPDVRSAANVLQEQVSTSSPAAGHREQIDAPAAGRSPQTQTVLLRSFLAQLELAFLQGKTESILFYLNACGNIMTRPGHRFTLGSLHNILFYLNKTNFEETEVSLAMEQLRRIRTAFERATFSEEAFRGARADALKQMEISLGREEQTGLRQRMGEILLRLTANPSRNTLDSCFRDRKSYAEDLKLFRLLISDPPGNLPAFQNILSNHSETQKTNPRNPFADSLPQWGHSLSKCYGMAAQMRALEIAWEQKFAIPSQSQKETELISPLNGTEYRVRMEPEQLIVFYGNEPTDYVKIPRYQKKRIQHGEGM